MFSQSNIPIAEFYQPYLNIMRYFRVTGIDLFGERLWTLPVFKYTWILVYCSYLLGAVSHSAETVMKLLNGADMVQLSADLSNTALMFQGCILYLHMYIKKDKIKMVVMKLAKNWPLDETLSKEMIALKKKKLRTLNITTKAYLTAVNFYIQIYLISPYAITIVRKYVLKQETEHLLAFSLKVPLDYKDNFASYTLVFLVQYCIEINYVFLENSDLFIMTVTMGHLQTLFLLLQDKFKQLCNQRIVSLEQYKIEAERLKIYVKQHVLLLQIPDEISSAFGGIFAINLVFVPVSVCFFGFSARVTGSLDSLGNLFASFIRSVYLYFCCLYGQRLTDSSLDIATAIYDSTWYDCPEKIKKSVLCIMVRSQHIHSITSAKFLIISLPTFTKVMNITWSLLSLMTTRYGGA